MLNLKKITIKSILKTYIFITALIGFLHMMSLLFSIFIFREVIPQEMSVSFRNGFTYLSKSENAQDKFLLDNKGKTIIKGGVKGLAIYKNFIYGYYDPPSPLYLYFICEAGKDCTNTRSYNRAKFDKLVKEKKIPPFLFPYKKENIQILTMEWLKRKLSFQEVIE